MVADRSMIVAFIKLLTMLYFNFTHFFILSWAEFCNCGKLNILYSSDKFEAIYSKL